MGFPSLTGEPGGCLRQGGAPAVRPTSWLPEADLVDLRPCNRGRRWFGPLHVPADEIHERIVSEHRRAGQGGRT